MPVAAPRGVTPSSLTDILPVPMGVIEEKGGAGLMELIKKLVHPSELASRVTPGLGSEEFSKAVLSGVSNQLAEQGIATEPGINVFPIGWGKSKQIIYTGSKGEVIGVATVHELTKEPGKFFTSEFAVDKAKGLLAGKAAASIGKKLIEMGAANVSGPISSDTYRLLQHLAKLAGK